MLKTMPSSGGQKRQPLIKHPVKLTALLYLKEAIESERYEQCQDLITIAKEFGAVDREIQDLLEDPRRSPV